MKQSPAEYYRSKTEEMTVSLNRRKAKNKYFVTAEILLFLAFAASVTALIADWCVEAKPCVYAFSSVAALSFVIVKRIDRRNQEEAERIAARLAVCRRETEYLDGKFSAFDSGERYVDPNHPYTFDMDVFGTESLYQRMCRAVTQGGADRLAKTLSEAALGNADATPSANYTDGIKRRREAIDELAPMADWRTDFLAFGHNGKIDTQAVQKSVDALLAEDLPHGFANGRTLLLVFAGMTVFVVLLLLSVFTSMSGNIPALWLVGQLWVSIAVSAKALKKASRALEGVDRRMTAYMNLIHHVTSASSRFESNTVKAVAATLAGAEEELKGMKNILNAIDRRGNILGLVIFNALAFSDVLLVRRCVRWTERIRGLMNSWIDAVSDIDALVSMATFRFNEPETVEPEIKDSQKLIFCAKSLRHPFLGRRAVGNDFTIDDLEYHIITGANMAGKSTFLRSVGTNYILAMAGLPVFAESMKVSAFALFSSMRTSDNLSGGISYFNAELLRLERLLDFVRHRRRTLIILDEILKGTNSLDKLNGSKMFLQAIAKMPVSGLIATHDLELSRLAEENPQRFHTYCFEIQLADDITYSYKITPGVARNQNATYLLRRMLAGRT